jgi:hypothetical protein
MNALFDDLTREIARGISRRGVLRLFGRGFAGMLLSSLGLKEASAAALTCGTCQTCDIATNVCGLPCNPPSAGQMLCTMANTDGSYLRLVNYLSTNGFLSEGASDSTIILQSGRLLGSGLATNFASSSVPGLTATISYIVAPTGGILAFAVVSQNGTPSYALNIDFDGRVVQTVAPKTLTSAASAPAASAATRQFAAPASQTTSLNALTPAAAAGAVTPSVCNTLFDVLCDHIGLGGIGCGLLGALLCSEFGPVGVVACGIVAGIICGFGSSAFCKAEQSKYCACPLNEVICNGVCCGPCMDCLIGPGSPNGQCVPNMTCSNVCCGNNICCADGLICSNGMCTSPNSACVGATCTTFVPCSANTDCVCVTISAGGGLCVPGSTPCAGLVSCATGACPKGSLCAIGTCCGDPVCVPVSLQCAPLASSFSLLPRAAIVSGPTIAHR